MKDLKPIKLPAPKDTGGKSVLAALKARRTVREISGKKLPLQLLSDLLWAAFGVNRKKGPDGIPGRTASTASNSQEIDLYVAMEDGVYLYEAVPHRLVPVVAGDLRALAINKGQDAVSANPPVRIIYVVDIDKLVYTKGYQEPGLRNPEVQKAYYYVATGWIAANVALFTASQGLAAWFHNCQKEALHEKLKLRSDQRVLFAQTVGWGKRS
ncbi:MAG TPA: nitroreductase family protein [Candidatus Omnitrophota bacterium]|nr:nitroreductase family protein [Candidatus Omnitrophota bacterium]